jgi:predicted Kef-type K+ transport protein
VNLIRAGAILSIVVNPLLFEWIARLQPWRDGRENQRKIADGMVARMTRAAA